MCRKWKKTIASEFLEAKTINLEVAIKELCTRVLEPTFLQKCQMVAFLQVEGILLSNTNNCLVIKFCCDHFVWMHQKKEMQRTYKDQTKFVSFWGYQDATGCLYYQKNSPHQPNVDHQMEVLGRGLLKHEVAVTWKGTVVAPFWMMPPLSFRNEVHMLVVIKSHVPAVYTRLFFHSREPSKAEMQHHGSGQS